MVVDSKKVGENAETHVCIALNIKGYTILERNFTSRFGEIDIIAIKNKKLALFEVKNVKKSGEAGFHNFPIKPKQIANIIKTFEYWELLNPSVSYKELDLIGAIYQNQEISWYRLGPI